MGWGGVFCCFFIDSYICRCFSWLGNLSFGLGFDSDCGKRSGFSYVTTFQRLAHVSNKELSVGR